MTSASAMPRSDGRTHAMVEWWSDNEGWGGLADCTDIPGGAFVHISAINTDEESRSLRPSPSREGGSRECPRQESNLRTWFRKPLL
jgi:hypothetical protein